LCNAIASFVARFTDSNGNHFLVSLQSKFCLVEVHLGLPIILVNSFCLQNVAE